MAMAEGCPMGQFVTAAGADAMTDPLHQLLKLKSRLEQKLSRNSDYRALQAIEHAIAELSERAPARNPPPVRPENSARSDARSVAC